MFGSLVLLFYNPMERHQSESNASKQYFKIVKPNEFTVISEKFLSKGSCDLKRFDIMTGRYDNDNVEGRFIRGNREIGK